MTTRRDDSYLRRQALPSLPAAPSRQPVTTLEDAGIVTGSRLLATPEEVAEAEAEHRRQVEAGTALIDQVLDSVTAARDRANEEAAAAWLDFAEESRRRRDQRRTAEASQQVPT